MSPILSNLYLHPLDEYMEKKQYKWIRFADDVKIYANTQETAVKAYQEVETFLKKELKLSVNDGKSGVFNAIERWVLGYEFYKYAGKIEIRKRRYRKLDMYSKWRPSAIQKVNQEYHIIPDGVLNKQAKLNRLKRELQDMINCSEDRVSVYELGSTRYMQKEGTMK